MNKRMQFTPAVKTLAGVVNEIKNVTRSGLDLQPKYQREFIWKDDFKDKLIYSLVRGYPIGNISIGVLNTPNEKKAMSEVVDGQQRLTTIYNFVINNYEIKYEYARKISEDIIDYLIDIDNDKELDNLKKKVSDGKRFRLTYKMLPEIIKDNVLNYQLSISNISESTREQIAEYFRFLQNQEILRAGEIINSLPDTRFKSYLMEVDDKDKFMKVIGFKDDRRKEFDKIFYSSIGVLDKAIAFGSPDRTIKRYITDTTGDLSEETRSRVNSMIEGINEISKLKPLVVASSNKRFVKFLLLLLGFSKFVFEGSSMEDVLLKLDVINLRLSAFNSAKKNAVPDTFSIFEPAEKRNDIIEDYRLIALFSRGIQVPQTTSERIYLLHEIIKRELYADKI